MTQSLFNSTLHSVLQSRWETSPFLGMIGASQNIFASMDTNLGSLVHTLPPDQKTEVRALQNRMQPTVQQCLLNESLLPNSHICINHTVHWEEMAACTNLSSTSFLTLTPRNSIIIESPPILGNFFRDLDGASLSFDCCPSASAVATPDASCAPGFPMSCAPGFPKSSPIRILGGRTFVSFPSCIPVWRFFPPRQPVGRKRKIYLFNFSFLQKCLSFYTILCRSNYWNMENSEGKITRQSVEQNYLIFEIILPYPYLSEVF